MEVINLLLNMNQINYELLIHWEEKNQTEQQQPQHNLQNTTTTQPPKQTKQKPERTGTTTQEISCKILVTNTQEK